MARFDLSPNRRRPGNEFHVHPKPFDDHITMVTNLAQRLGNAQPINMVAAWCAPVAAAGVQMAEVLAGFADSGRLVLFFDVHVERVELDFERGTAYITNHLQGLVAGVDEIRLESIQRFEANPLPRAAACALRDFRCLTTVFHCCLYSGRGTGSARPVAEYTGPMSEGQSRTIMWSRIRLR